MAAVEIKNLSKSFGTHKVLKDINLSINDGEFLTLVGPSGCGKSTLIRIIAGLEPQTSGSILVDGAPIDHLRPHERRIAMVFQSYALYPHMSVFNNMALPLTMTGLNLYERLPLVRLLSSRRRKVMQEIGKQVRGIAAQLQIEPLLERKPAQLSGGQRQRVALGRAMVRQPAAFLMDEPLSNLDAKLRVHMRSELAELHQRLGATFVYVTHDQVEAMTMSSRVAMMEGGDILQLGTPDELYDRPANIQVAQFIGSPTINLVPATVGVGGRLELLGKPLPIGTALPAGEKAMIGVRPEMILPGAVSGQSTDQVPLAAKLRRSEHLGSEKILHFDVPSLPGILVTSRIGAGVPDSEVENTELLFHPSACHVFDAAGNRVEPQVSQDAATAAKGKLRLAEGARAS
ncbi:ABC transporter ATP-binding protein [Mesorhizobium sp. B292B1B]|uniref:ABC transporter ATP-binding protein n=1 Tax=unclassified Mesorhizobium TaxID=325217 RepID=UPI001126CCE1|nr:MULTISPECIES: ABC transporter ATP-binding protein [unclassified Mesorhizobium]MBZ9966577.1 ABC transporter ATP-binding protein [Mesorhizobium sp. BR1-1-2]MCA0014399.1 ABC transporter ATP-binding protein [Mesorhizobium sp. B294B1A1]MCA0036440.1 ABC transporter ATP-binding protein [Mesorhizobium sp. B292B1B]TPM42160.1 ABC transporter ATP-binding protein [Mesorhizobium sp. B2-3-2]